MTDEIELAPTPTLRRIAAVLFLLAVPVASIWPAYSDTPTEIATMPKLNTATIDPAVAAPLAAYDANHDVAALEDAADAAARDDGETMSDPAAALVRARMRIATWTAILARFKRDIDPDFDPRHPPPMSITPPGELGLQYSPGVDPRDVDDPELRRLYLIAIEKNKERVARFSQAVKLNEVHETILERAGSSLRDAHQTLGLPKAEIAAACDRADIIPADRNALRAAIAQ